MANNFVSQSSSKFCVVTYIGSGNSDSSSMSVISRVDDGFVVTGPIDFSLSVADLIIERERGRILTAEFRGYRLYFVNRQGHR